MRQWHGHDLGWLVTPERNAGFVFFLTHLSCFQPGWVSMRGCSRLRERCRVCPCPGLELFSGAVSGD